ncbi:MAG: hypothetical protein A3G27_16325 [Betaproteobacteria bacterium RIFCSPLOWO2_12_FULL_66_14]|nr:MAG: hypothetical protein A3G27_16325 [Betaproteobacteria bacterium RIFCSPLOWO2_12_FULL_66_14]
MSKTMLSLLGALVLGTLFAPPAAAQSAKIPLGYPPAPDFLPAFVAHEPPHFYARYGEFEAVVGRSTAPS